MNKDGLIPEDQIKGEDEEETRKLKSMLQRAKAYIGKFTWCPPIARAYMGLGIGGVVGVFLIQLKEKIKGQDEYLWVVEGDLPSAYLVIDNAQDPISALEIYCELMEDWILAVEKGDSLKDVYPVDAPADKKHAAMLRSRIQFIRGKILTQQGEKEGTLIKK